MRILIVTDTYYPDVTGVAKTLNSLSMGLALRGHEVEVVTPSAKGQAGMLQRSLRIQPTTAFPLLGYPGLRWGFKSYQGWLSALRRTSPDVLYVAVESLLGYNAVKAAKSLGIPVVTGFHTKFHHYSAKYQMAWIKELATQYLKHFHQMADLTLVPSETVKRELEALGVQKLGVLGRGIDTQCFHPRKRCQALREIWGAAPNEPVMLSVGRVAAEKNLELFFKTYESLRLRRSNLQAVVVGDGPKRAEYQKRYPEVHFVGTKHGEELARHYASADLFIFPSLTETYGNVVLEALASGLVVTSYHDAAAAEWITSYKNGYLAEVGQETDFLDKCRLALQHWKDGRLRRLAAERLKDQQWDGIIERFENELRVVIQQRTKSIA